MNKLKSPKLDKIAYDYNSSNLLYNIDGQILKVYCINLSCRPEYKIVAIALKYVLYRNLFKQDSRAIQYPSEIVNDTILKYIKTVIICFGWGAPSQTPSFYQCKVP